MMTSRTEINKASFPDIDSALTCARDVLQQNGLGEVTVQILGGSNKWPDPARRYRVTTCVTRKQ